MGAEAAGADVVVMITMAVGQAAEGLDVVIVIILKQQIRLLTLRLQQQHRLVVTLLVSGDGLQTPDIHPNVLCCVRPFPPLDFRQSGRA